MEQQQGEFNSNGITEEESSSPMGDPSPPPSAGNFEECVTEVMMGAEELRRSLINFSSSSDNNIDSSSNGTGTTIIIINEQQVVEWQYIIDGLVQRLDYLFRLCLDSPGDDIKYDLFKACGRKIYNVGLSSLQLLTKPQQPLISSDIPDIPTMEGQGAIARVAELTLIVNGMITKIISLEKEYRGGEGGQHQQQQHRQEEEDSSYENYDKQVIDTYTTYQRQILRQRCKPSIAQLAQWRTNPSNIMNGNNNNNGGFVAVIEEEDDDEDDEEAIMAKRQPHTHAMMTILGQGSSLIHPLIQWKQSVTVTTNNNGGESPPSSHSSPIYNMCQSAIDILDEQSQTLTKTISEWFHIDRNIDDWMAKTVEMPEAENVQQVENSTKNIDLGGLDRLLEEVSFACQILARYDMLIGNEISSSSSLSSSDNNNNEQSKKKHNIISKELLPEWTWKYATLERYLSKKQWQHAKTMAKPVEIVVGTSIRVPSVVEDAQYLSSRGMERASSTLNTQAMGTVSHAISHDIWNSTEDITGGIYEALINQIGCWVDYEEEEKIKKKQSGNTLDDQKAPNSGDGLAALLDAIDGDDGDHNTGSSSQPNSAPPSGGIPSGGLGIFGSLTSKLSNVGSAIGGSNQQQQLKRLDMQLCNLNGIHSASVACLTLVNIISSHLNADDDEEDQEEESTKNNNKSKSSSSTSMVELAKEELERYSKSYQNLLHNQTSEVISEWCGCIDGPKRANRSSSSTKPCLHSLYNFFIDEDYDIDSSTFKVKTTDDRLDNDMMGPIRNSAIMKNIDKCDEQVTATVCIKLASVISTILLKQTIYYHNPYDDGIGNHHPDEAADTTEQQRQRRRGGRPFTVWGSLLFAKEVALLQNFIYSIVENCTSINEASSSAADTITGTGRDSLSSIRKEFDKVDAVLLILQLDKKSDFAAYHQNDNSCLALSQEEIDIALSLRTDY